ncbi:MAG: DUF6621 family protein [Prevotella sp.]|jgi:hypothetical protein
MNQPKTDNIKLSENFILADADYIDKVAFNLTVNFERMLGRKIPQADISQWAVDVALDGGLRPDGKDHETQLMLIYDEKKLRMENFQPSDLKEELHGKAFRDPQLGEFLVNAYPTTKIADKDDYLLETLKTLTEHPEVHRVMVVPNAENGDIMDRIRDLLRRADNDEQRITVFAMIPLEGGNFRTENLGFSLTDALGVRSEEFH